MQILYVDTFGVVVLRFFGWNSDIHLMILVTT